MINLKFKTQNLALFLLLALYIALAATYSVVTPLGEGPDEPGHAAYAFFLARTGRLPNQRTREVPGEGHQPPLAYALAAPMLLWLPAKERALELPGNPRFVWAGGDQVNVAGHGSREFWPWPSAVLGWHMARLVSVLCGAATVWFTYLAARRLTNSASQSKIPLLAASLVAFNPQFLFTSGLISNDALLAALSAALLWLALRQHAGARSQEPPARSQELIGQRNDREHANQGNIGGVGNALALGIVLGLALLTKLSAVVLVPVALLGAVSIDTAKLSSRLRVLSSCLLVLLATGATCGWWYWRNWQLYGDPLGLAAFQSEFTTQPFDSTSAAAWVGALAQLHSSFWARFGWMNVAPPGWVLWALGVLEAVAACGWALTLMRRPTDDRRPMQHMQALIVVALLAGTFVWLLAFARTAGLVAWQGRLLFPALPAIALVLAVGIARLVAQVEQHWPMQLALLDMGMCIPVGFAALALWLPFGVIARAYPPQVLPERTALATLGTPVYGRFTPGGRHGAELRGYQIAGDVRPGATLDIALVWHALGRQTRNWTVFVHLVDANEQIVAQDNREPRNGAYPMGLWVKGDWVEDMHTLLLPATLPTGTYWLRIGTFDAAGTQERTGVYTEHNRLIGDYLELGTIQVKN